MGQYYIAVNLIQRSYIDPRWLGNGTKLMEFACSGSGLMTGLAVLLADGNGCGGGDLESQNPIIGSWAGDNVVLAGDYGDDGKWLEMEAPEDLQRKDPTGFVHKHNLYSFAREHFTNISAQVIEALCDDVYVCKKLAERGVEFAELKNKKDMKKKS